MTPAVSFGLVGAGGVAQSYLQAFTGLEEAHIVGVADVRLDVASSAAEAHGCGAFSSWQEMVERTRPEAALVCTPPSTHAEICMGLLGTGTAVLCEKPFTTDLPSARELAEVSASSGTLLTMASKFRYVQDVIRAKSILASGILGEIILLENVFASRAEMSARWNSDPAVSGGGVLIDNGTHSVDVVRYFLGPIVEVLAVEGKRVQSVAVEDTVQLFARADNGARATIDLSWSIDKERDTYLEIYGSHGTVSVGWRESRYRQATSADWVVFGSGYDKVAAMRAQVVNFCRALRGEERLLIDTEDALASVAVIEKAYRSLERSRWVPVDGDGAAPSRSPDPSPQAVAE